MKKIRIKRLIYTALDTGEVMYGCEQYDGHLTDENILGMIHTEGKSIFNDAGLVHGQSSLIWFKDNLPAYKVTVESCYQYEKTTFDLLKDNIKRILRI